jgi:hypothetical protein
MAATDLPTTSAAYNAAWQSAPSGYTAPSNDGLGTSPGQVGHVWVIVLENHAYEQSFTPLEGTQSSYLQQLPNQGALLTHYYGTGHSSLDNYVSMVSGQAPQADDQSDCPNYSEMDGSVDLSGSPATNSDFGQFKSNAGPGAPNGDNGCVYPSSVNTIFNQLQTAGKTWKVYAQDLGGGATTAQSSGSTTLGPPNTGQDAGGSAGSNYQYQYCGAPETSVAAAPDTQGTYASPSTQSNAGSTTNLNLSGGYTGGDQYVAKHNPLAWFDSILGATDTTGGSIDGPNCNSNHLGALFGPDDTLYNDLQSTSSTPNLSFIVPNNCSNGHDATCDGNNLSGGTSNGYTNGTINSATNNTGGTVAESNFLKIVVPEIEASPAWNANGMIVVTYDEAYPPFTYTSDTQADSQLQTADAVGSLGNDAAGETLYGRSLGWEPTGPNEPIVKSPLTGQVLSAGPGDGAYIDRPNTAAGTATGNLVNCTEPSGLGGVTWTSFFTPGTVNAGVTSCVPGYQSNGFGSGKTYDPTSIHLDLTNGSSTGTTTEGEAGVTPAVEGATTNLPIGSFTDAANGSYAGSVYIGQVTNSPNAGDETTAASAYTSTVNLVDSEGNPLVYIGTTTPQMAVTLSAIHSDAGNDPFFDAYDATMGGGDSGAVVISPFVTPGTVSNSYYNHYSLLRTLEDVFGEQSNGSNDLTGGITPGSTTETSLNGPYLGFAGQPGLAPFGTDVFTNSGVDTSTVTQTQTGTHTVTQTQTQTQTVTTPGGTSTVTTPGSTRTRTVTKSVVPFVVGATLGQARSAIRDDKLAVGKISGKGSQVASETPRAGSYVATGTKVSLKLRK